MSWVALVTWIFAAGGGFALLTRWLSRGGMRQPPQVGNRIRPPLILSHFLLAAAGLVVWIVYLASDADALAWIALAILVLVALLGWTMFAIWWRRRTATEGGVVTADTPPEQQFPVPIVAIHGLLAVTTVVLVFLVAIGVGES